MLDQEISRLQEVRSILQSLVLSEKRVAPLLTVVAAKSEPVEALAEAAPETVRHVSRRGISTGTRGPRRVKEVVAPGPLSAAVPKAPVVVPRSALEAAKPVAAPPVATPLEGTLESWVRSLKQAGSLS